MEGSRYMSLTTHLCPPQRAGREDGATMVEYAVLVGGMALVVAGAVAFFSGKIVDLLNTISL
jgi:Flp pilus assembly pilin Flp